MVIESAEAVAMAELTDELGYPREISKQEVVSAFLQVVNNISVDLFRVFEMASPVCSSCVNFCSKVVDYQCNHYHEFCCFERRESCLLD